MPTLTQALSLSHTLAPWCSESVSFWISSLEHAATATRSLPTPARSCLLRRCSRSVSFRVWATLPFTRLTSTVLSIHTMACHMQELVEKCKKAKEEGEEDEDLEREQVVAHIHTELLQVVPLRCSAVSIFSISSSFRLTWPRVLSMFPSPLLPRHLGLQPAGNDWE